MQPAGSRQKYVTVHTAPTLEDLADHLAGKSTIAGYLVDQDGTARAWAADVDAGGRQAVRARVAALSAAGLPCFGQAAPGSGGHDGGHIWGVWPVGVDPAAGRAQIRAVLDAAGLAHP